MRGATGYFSRSEDVRRVTGDSPPRGQSRAAAADLAGSTVLMRSVTALARGSLEAGSVKTYTPGLHKFQAFVKDTCAKLGRPVWPHETTSELRELVSTKGVVEAFVAYAHEKDLRDNTIDLYIAGLKYFATDAFGRPQIPDSLTVKRLLKGCQKAQGAPRDGKLGIGILRLRKLVNHLNRKGGTRSRSEERCSAALFSQLREFY